MCSCHEIPRRLGVLRVIDISNEAVSLLSPKIAHIILFTLARFVHMIRIGHPILGTLSICWNKEKINGIFSIAGQQRNERTIVTSNRLCRRAHSSDKNRSFY